jgi:hypothetical protein
VADQRGRRVAPCDVTSRWLNKGMSCTHGGGGGRYYAQTHVQKSSAAGGCSCCAFCLEHPCGCGTCSGSRICFVEQRTAIPRSGQSTRLDCIGSTRLNAACPRAYFGGVLQPAWFAVWCGAAATLTFCRSAAVAAVSACCCERSCVTLWL